MYYVDHEFFPANNCLLIKINEHLDTGVIIEEQENYILLDTISAISINNCKCSHGSKRTIYKLNITLMCGRIKTIDFINKEDDLTTNWNELLKILKLHLMKPKKKEKVTKQ